MTTIQLQQQLPSLPPQERLALQRRARLLAWGGNAWHLIEFGVAILAGVIAASPALIGFSLHSLIELAVGFVIVWLFWLRSGHADEPCAGVRRPRLSPAGRLYRRRIDRGAARRPTPGGELAWDRPGCLHRCDDAATRADQAACRVQAGFLRYGVRSRAEPDLRLPFNFTAGRLDRQRARGLAVGRPGCARDRRPRDKKEGLDSWRGNSCDCS